MQDQHSAAGSPEANANFERTSNGNRLYKLHILFHVYKMVHGAMFMDIIITNKKRQSHITERK